MDWMEKVQEAARTDVWYQQALAEVQRLEPAYLQILQGLPEEQREAVTTYITACEAMDDALVRIAYEIGSGKCGD